MTINKTHLLKIILILVLLLSSGCFMHPYTEYFVYFPYDGSIEFPYGPYKDTSQYSLSITIHGVSGHAITESTKKKIYILIRDKDKKVLLERKYILDAGNVHCDIYWTNLEDLKIVFYENGYYEIMKDLNYIPKQLFALSFSFDSSSDKFTEKAIPNAVLSKLRSKVKRALKKHVISFDLRFNYDDFQYTAEVLKGIAANFNLSELKYPGNCSNCFAFYFEHDFEMSVLYMKGAHEGQFYISLADWDRRDLSNNIATALKQSFKRIIKVEYKD